MERPEPNPHAKHYEDRVTRREVRPIELDAVRTRTGQPAHLRQARFATRRALVADVAEFGVPTKGKTLKQIRIAVAKAKAAGVSA